MVIYQPHFLFSLVITMRKKWQLAQARHTQEQWCFLVFPFSSSPALCNITTVSVLCITFILDASVATGSQLFLPSDLSQCPAHCGVSSKSILHFLLPLPHTHKPTIKCISKQPCLKHFFFYFNSRKDPSCLDPR
jgi:hypothetical protein